MQKINFITPIVFEILKLKNPAIWLVESIFCILTRQPDFSQTCGFNRIIKVIMVHELNLKNLHINWLFFRFFEHYFQKENFSKKPGSISFLLLKHPIFMRSSRKIQWAVLKKTLSPPAILTHWLWWNHRGPPFHLKAGIRKVHDENKTNPLGRIINFK